MIHALPLDSSVTPRRSLRAAVAVIGVALAVFGCSDGWDAPSIAASDVRLQGDADCAIDNEPSAGDECSQDCLTATCFSGVGRRVCTCQSGVFVQCACLPPDYWPYEEVPVAPFCDAITGHPKFLATTVCSAGQECRSTAAPEFGCRCGADLRWQCGASSEVSAGAPTCESFGKGMTATLKDKPCETEFEVCIARDYNPTSTTPRGCVCLHGGSTPTTVGAGALQYKCSGTNRWWRAE